MKRLAQFASLVALAGTIAPPVLDFLDRLTLDGTKSWMLAATVLWFVATPLWMDRQ